MPLGRRGGGMSGGMWRAVAVAALVQVAVGQNCQVWNACNPGFMLKINANALACVGAACNTALCCDFTCSNAGWAGCAATTGFNDKPGLNAISCGANIAGCTVTACCDATCENTVWTGCVAANGFLPKVSINTIMCATSAPTSCTPALCCDSNCANAGFACDPGFVAKATQTAISCGPTSAFCNNARCCDATCDNGGFDCNAYAGQIAKAGQAGITCGVSVADCTPNACCDVKCSHPGYTCPPGYTDKATQNSVTCGATVADCTPAACCDVNCAFGGWVCGAGFEIKNVPAPATITCGATLAACTNGMCCDAMCDHAGFACGAGTTPKPNLGNIRCGASVGDCTDAICCDATCANAGFSCATFAGAVAKAGAAAITCGPSAASCTQTQCCDATCAHPAFACPTGFTTKAAPNSITCGANAAICTTTQCCDVNCGHGGFVCSAGFVLKGAPAAITCGASVADCTNGICCDFTCSNAGFTCPAGYQAKGNQATITCGTALGDCTAAMCCDATCSNGGFGCSPGFIGKVNQAAIVCGAAVGDCTNALCCDANCANGGFACSTGYTAKGAAATLRCGPTSGSCTDNFCCDATCNNAGWGGCAGQFVDKGAIAGVVCGATPAFCNSATCCDVTCQSHTCSAGFVLKNNHPMLTCGALATDCTDNFCCDFTCSNAGYNCPAGFTSRGNAPTIRCGPALTDCNENTCCDTTCSNANFACGSGWTPKVNQAAITCGATPGDCTNQQCCSANCLNPGFACAAGETLTPGAGGIVCGATALSCTSGICCDATLCTANQKVVNNACVACEPGSTNAANDDASGTNTACDAVICGPNEYVESNICRPCAAGSTNTAGDTATGPDTFCDTTRCLVNQFVQASSCLPCAPGTQNAAGDPATGADTMCTPIICAANQHVVNNRCVNCQPGAMRPAGDDSSGADTACSAMTCLANERVVGNVCVACPPGTTNQGGDPATGPDTTCDQVLCQANLRVVSHVCTQCPLGSRNDAGDDASGADTGCDPILCAANQRVVQNACAACQPGSTNAADDDASGADTVCDPILCAANQKVIQNACTACELGSTNAPDDDATGPDTFCDPTLCAAGERVINNQCVACNPGETNAALDDATGPNTFCDVTYCRVDRRVLNNACVPCANGFRRPAGDPANGPDTRCIAGAGVTVQPRGILTTEDGGTATIEVFLNSQPFQPVTFAVRSSDDGEGQVDKAELVFRPSDWGAAQVVTVTGQQDAKDDGDKSYRIVIERAQSADTEYDGLDPGSVQATNMDDDTTGITVTPISGLETTEAGGTATFGVRLHTQPTDVVTVGISSGNPNEGTVEPAEITFLSSFSNVGQWWGTLQTIVVTGADDFTQDGDIAYEIFTAPATSNDAGYAGINAADVTVTNIDNDVSGVRATPTSLITTEDGATTATVQVQLSSMPRFDVQLAVATTPATEATVNPGVLMFTQLTWDQPQMVVVTGVDDNIADGATPFNVTLSTSSGDSNYADLNWPGVGMINNDDDTAGISVVVVGGAAQIVVDEAGQQMGSFTIALDSEPIAPVTISMAPSMPNEGSVSSSEIIFKPGAQAPVTVFINGLDDAIDDGDVAWTVDFESAVSMDPLYSGMPVASLQVTTTDNDVAGVLVEMTAAQPLVTTEAGGTTSFTLRLKTEPTADVTISIQPSDHTEATTDVDALTWTPMEWNQPRVVTVTGRDDSIDDDDVEFEVVTGTVETTDVAYASVDPPNVRMINRDDDIASIVVAPLTGLETTEGGRAASFNITMTSQPVADVAINIFSSDSSEGRVQPTQVIFTQNSWATPRQINVIGVQDAVDDGDVTFTVNYGAIMTADPKYVSMQLPIVTLVNREDDEAGVTVSAPSGGLAVDEDGGEAYVTVVLNTQPLNDVTVAVSTNSEAQAAVSPAVLTFKAEGGLQQGRGDWSTPHTITVTAVDDNAADGDVAFRIEFPSVTSDDSRYRDWPIQPVNGVARDNDAAEVVVSPLNGHIVSETGRTSFYTMRLATQPLEAVTCDVQSGDATEAMPSVSMVTFTTTDWREERTVSILGVDDSIFDGDIALTIMNMPCRSNDPRYGAVDPADVSVTNLDVNSAGAYLLTTVSLPAGVDAPDALCTRVVADAEAAWGLDAGYIIDCRAAVSSPTDVRFDVVTFEVHQTGPKVSACDALSRLQDTILAAPSRQTVLAGRTVRETTARPVGCVQQYCSQFPAGNCMSGTLVANAATRVCGSSTCDAMTCCSPGDLQVALYTSSSCTQSDWMIRQVDPLQICQPVIVTGASSVSNPAQYGAFHCDTASGMAYVRTGFSSQGSCGDSVGTVAGLIADPQTVKFRCDCRRAVQGNFQVNPERQCVPLIGGLTDRHAQCGAVGNWAAAPGANDDDGLADWEWWLIGIGILLFVVLVGAAVVLSQKKKQQAKEAEEPDNEVRLLEQYLSKREGQTVTSFAASPVQTQPHPVPYGEPVTQTLYYSDPNPKTVPSVYASGQPPPQPAYGNPVHPGSASVSPPYASPAQLRSAPATQLQYSNPPVAPHTAAYPPRAVGGTPYVQQPLAY